VLDFQKFSAAQLLPNFEFLAPPLITAGFTAWAAFSNAGLQHFFKCMQLACEQHSMLSSVNKPAAHTCARLETSPQLIFEGFSL
jgi:hypothetical protein